MYRALSPEFWSTRGAGSSQFGEFDFILASPQAVYLGESKWDKSSELIQPQIDLRKEQHERHTVFSAYYRTWISRAAWEWEEYLDVCKEQFRRLRIQKPIAPANSLLGQNLQNALSTLAMTTRTSSRVRHILLVIDTEGNLASRKMEAPGPFELVVIDATSKLEDGFVPLTPVEPLQAKDESHAN